MSEKKRWSGNETSNISLYDKELEKLIQFVENHKNIYIFGNGKIGKAFRYYLTEAKITCAGNLTSECINQFERDYVIGESGIIMGVSDQYYQEIMPLLEFVDRCDICSLSATKREEIGRIFSIETVKEKFWINIFTTNQCNLNCKSCSSFAPICSPDYYSLEQFKQDILKLRELKFEKISTLKFTGGEPFLHPQIFQMFKFARETFPDVPIECYTNGLILTKMKDEKIRDLSRLRITLIFTEYPIEKLNLKSLYERADKLSVSYCVIYSEGQKYFSKRPLNFTGNTNPCWFVQCPRYKMCDSLFLYKGKLYKCIYVLASKYFNQAFGTELKVAASDWVDLYETVPEEVYRYCISRLSYCGYCEPIEELVPWELSERKITEWT